MQATQKFSQRQNLNNQEFEVFHYRDESLASVGVHHHNCYELYFLVGGPTSYWVEGRTYRLEYGDLLLISPQELHQPLARPNAVYERLVLWIDRRYLQALGGDEMDLSACFEGEGRGNLLRPTPVERRRIQDLLEQLTREFYGNGLGDRLYAQGLLLQLMVEVNRLARRGSRPGRPPQETDLVSRVVEHINRHVTEPLTLESLARLFYVSVYHLSHAFTRETGTSIYRYVVLKRLVLAREYLSQGHAPGAVYKLCGFGDYANFYRAFKKEYGVSPSEFAANP